MAKILFGVSSSVSLYKTLDLVSYYKKAGHEVHVIMTKNASKLLSPKLFSSLSGNYTFVDTFDLDREPGISHIEITKDVDCFAVVPGTANIISKLAFGIADDLLTTTALACEAPLLIAPAMNPGMWEKSIIQENLKKLKNRGVLVVTPVFGKVACGDVGQGRLASIEDIRQQIDDIIGASFDSSLRGTMVVVTAGGSSEPIDPVRSITNLSSGKMGFELATNLMSRGAKVIYIYGNISTDLPEATEYIRFSTTDSLFHILTKKMVSADVLIMAAAPGDFAVDYISPQKIKKSDKFSLNFVKNRDILATLPKNKSKFYVGFAAETDDIIKNATKKLKQKKIDMIVANPVISQGSEKEYGIGKNDCKIHILNEGGTLFESDIISKKVAAKYIINEIERHYEK